MVDKPISLGSMILTLVEPHSGHQRAYNRWYEDDHLYATLLGPSAIAGGRFVARRQEKARRPLPAGERAAGSLLAVYWLIGDGTDHAEWRRTNVVRLAREGRVYLERDLIFGFVGRLAFWRSRPTCPVPIELALDHRFGHLAMTVLRPGADGSATELGRRYQERCAPQVVAPGSPVALCAGFVARRAPDPRKPGAVTADAETGAAGPGTEGGGAKGGGPGGGTPAGRADGGGDGMVDELVVLWFCDQDPASQWDDLLSGQRRAVEDGGAGAVVWASSFVATVVGTDTYLDQL